MGGKVLVIDDDLGTRESLRMMLKDSHTVLLADSARDGLRFLDDDVDIVFLDYILPDNNGIDVLREIKTSHPAIPVVIITGYGTEELCQKVFRIGAIDYIKKPFDRGEIKAKVELLLKIRQGRTEQRQPVFLEFQNTIPEDAIKGIPSHILNVLVMARNYIDENYMARMHISTVIKEAGISRAYFFRYFKRLTGYSYNCYLSNLRIQRAIALLRNKNLLISDVAFAVGYDNLSHFIRKFKQITGLSPMTFRNLPS